MTATKQTVVEVSLHEIEKLLERAKREPLNEEQCALIRDLAVSYLHLTDMVKDRETSLAQLRKALFGSTSEKTKAVLAQIAQDGDAEAPVAASSDGTAPRRLPSVARAMVAMVRAPTPGPRESPSRTPRSRQATAARTARRAGCAGLSRSGSFG